jgi:ABC-type sugar transport system ATPase subunit
MQNIEVKVEKNKLVLTVDLTKRLGPSSSGKTTIVASTAGNAKIEGHEGLQFGLNVFAKDAAAAEKGGNKKG